MSVRLAAHQTVTYLPNPEFGDSEALLSEVKKKRAVDGTLYTYIKTTDRRKLLFQFKLTREKALELYAFFKAYHSTTISLIDHNGIEWVGKFTSNPFDFEDGGRDEQQEIQFEFEGEEV
jgi:hypothetical protein